MGWPPLYRRWLRGIGRIERGDLLSAAFGLACGAAIILAYELTT